MASGPASQEASCRQRDSDRKKERKRENTGVRRRISTQDEMKRSHSPVLNVDLCADKNSHPEFGPSSVILVLSWAAGHVTHTPNHVVLQLYRKCIVQRNFFFFKS